MIGKALRDHRAEHPLDFEIDLGDEIDRALLLDAHAGAELGHLEIAGAHDRLDRGGEELRIGLPTEALAEVAITRPLFGAS